MRIPLRALRKTISRTNSAIFARRAAFFLLFGSISCKKGYPAQRHRITFLSVAVCSEYFSLLFDARQKRTANLRIGFFYR